MKLAIQKLEPAADFVIVDALYLDVPIAQRALIQGDARCHAIAAASILAKVERDACMCEWDAVFPNYGLARHKGYSTPEHSDALASNGLTPLHRLSFAPVRSRSLFPTDLEEQMDLFDNMAMRACR
jgi:ribonuclease HII